MLQTLEGLLWFECYSFCPLCTVYETDFGFLVVLHSTLDQSSVGRLYSAFSIFSFLVVVGIFIQQAFIQDPSICQRFRGWRNLEDHLQYFPFIGEGLKFRGLKGFPQIVSAGPGLDPDLGICALSTLCFSAFTLLIWGIWLFLDFHNILKFLLKIKILISISLLL